MLLKGKVKTFPLKFLENMQNILPNIFFGFFSLEFFYNCIIYCFNIFFPVGSLWPLIFLLFFGGGWWVFSFDCM